jgi:hypothetical protein
VIEIFAAVALIEELLPAFRMLLPRATLGIVIEVEKAGLWIATLTV